MVSKNAREDIAGRKWAVVTDEVYYPCVEYCSSEPAAKKLAYQMRLQREGCYEDHNICIVEIKEEV